MVTWEVATGYDRPTPSNAMSPSCAILPLEMSNLPPMCQIALLHFNGSDQTKIILEIM
jgi:hypothetical protein